ncbi:hypothetical protein GCM10010954_27290 [Halobacillus andaensis]|uniref:DUF1697 domain-containing protein n=1 Tax=Halobacillus andaensis TaxID=1176239 RepID=A0A917B6A1_HALAA|nr:DUF1697 domain-containing protein [Halobacillus andaensis]MBP2005685.1 uncharacterized protein (DUF1697 family) [Halobacillus andaensis]GGF26778.1 hypothetical protein GCM10010954_27290 [Halobacillus andaensis]
MIYVALLRGINVGGKNKIDMKLLKQTFERVGMTSVVTYINSGNIVFTDHQFSENELPFILEKAIEEDFGLRINVVIRSFNNFKKVIASLPESWKNDKLMKSDVLFLWDDIDDETVLEELVIKSDIDTVKYIDGAILWSVDRNNVTKSGMQRLVGSKVYKQMTIRNVNTTRKIYELMQAVEKE